MCFCVNVLRAVASHWSHEETGGFTTTVHVPSGWWWDFKTSPGDILLESLLLQTPPSISASKESCLPSFLLTMEVGVELRCAAGGRMGCICVRGGCRARETRGWGGGGKTIREKVGEGEFWVICTCTSSLEAYPSAFYPCTHTSKTKERRKEGMWAASVRVVRAAVSHPSLS